jgi:L-iditol 2-dehydrogenase
MCSHQGIIGFNHDGGFAELMAIPSGTIARGGVNVVPSRVDAAMVSLTEPLACCVHGQRAAKVSDGDVVVIFGGGPMGLMHAALCKMRECPTMVVEPDMDRRGMAMLMGAERVVDPTKASVPEEIAAWTSHRGADVAILATPQVRVDDGLMNMMAPRGRICAFSGLPRTEPWSTVDLNLLHYRELAVIGAYGCTSDSDREALKLLVRGEIDLSPLISQRMPLGEIENAFKLIEERQALKCVIDDLTR